MKRTDQEALDWLLRHQPHNVEAINAVMRRMERRRKQTGDTNDLQPKVRHLYRLPDSETDEG